MLFQLEKMVCVCVCGGGGEGVCSVMGCENINVDNLNYSKKGKG